MLYNVRYANTTGLCAFCLRDFELTRKVRFIYVFEILPAVYAGLMGEAMSPASQIPNNTIGNSGTFCSTIPMTSPRLNPD